MAVADCDATIHEASPIVAAIHPRRWPTSWRASGVLRPLTASEGPRDCVVADTAFLRGYNRAVPRTTRNPG